MNNYKLSGSIQKDNNQALTMFELINRIAESGRRINGDTISDITYQMVKDGLMDSDVRTSLVQLADSNEMPSNMKLITQEEYFNSLKK